MLSRTWMACAVALLVAACAGSAGTTVASEETSETTGTTVVESASPVDGVNACLLLTDAEVSEYVGRAVAGAPVGEVNSLNASLNQCGWAEGPDDVPRLQLGVWENTLALGDFAAAEGSGLAAEPIEGLDVPVVWVHSAEADPDFGIDIDSVFYLVADTGSLKVQITPSFDTDPSTVAFDDLKVSTAPFDALVDLLSKALDRL